MSTFLRFPGFKRKALTLSYDDGTCHDKRLVEITPMPEERDRRIARNRAMLRALARRSKK